MEVIGTSSVAELTKKRHRWHEQECGLHLIWEPDQDDIRPENQVEIIAIHAPRQEWRQNWTSTKNTYCWLEEAIPKIVPAARVFSFGYIEGPESAANSLLSELFQERQKSPERSQNPIIIIGHSVGGIVAKKLFLITHPTLNERDQVQEIHKCLKGFVFLGTDHYNWPGTQGLLDRIARLNGLVGMSQVPEMKRAVADLEEFQSQSPRINHDFAFRGGENFPMACFYEMPSRQIHPWMKKSTQQILVHQENATLPYAWVENRPLHKDHLDLGRFDENDKECSVLVELIQYIVKQIRDPMESKAPGLQQESLSFDQITRLPSILPTPKLERRRSSEYIAPPRPMLLAAGDGEVSHGSTSVCLLSLDGGGIKGIFAVVVLEAIMESVRQYENPELGDPPQPCDYFDIIGGTSTGGLLAIMLGRLRMDLVSCRVAYKALATRIFQQSWVRLPGQNYYDNWRGNPMYSGEALKSSIQEIVSERLTMKEKATLQEMNIKPAEAPLASRDDPGCKTFVCAVRESKEDGCERLRTYDSKKGVASPCKIWEACRATSAAPLYFPPIDINGHTYYDGGVNSNNPIKDVYEEAEAQGLENDIEAIVSIGTGKPLQLNPGRTAYEALSYAVKRMTGTESDHLDFKKRPEATNKYFRFNEEDELHKIDMADWKQVGRVEELACAYVSKPHIKAMIEQCARKIAKPPRESV
ncbi:acyl transferase/acyl hydrolase/lysophospholipase [Halenospora varia]|nr:acyl transferase/acyl hydrolase/lysophospholipase [Halenospora varia]